MTPALSSEIEQYLSSQELFEKVREAALLRTGRKLCDLAYANAHDGVPRHVRAAIRTSLDSERALGLQYTPYGGATITRRLVARQLSASHNERFHWRDVVMTPGAMAGLNIVLRATKRDGDDEAIVVTPCWLDYPLYLANLGFRPRFVPVLASSLRLDLDGIRAKLGPSTRAVLLSQPANPTGTLYSAEELRQLADILDASPTRPLLISDECHREVLFDDAAFVSPLAAYDSTCIVHSFGKSLFMQGQRIGYVAVGPRFPDGRAWSTLLERLCRTMGFCTPTALMQLAIRDLLQVVPDLSTIAARRKRTLAALDEGGYDVTPSQATFFLYPRAPGADDFSFVERLADRGVLVLPASMFHHRGHFRISLTATDAMLDAALPVMAELMERRQA